MDDLDRTEEMPRSADDVSPLSVGRSRARRTRATSLPPPIPARAKRWTPSPTIDGVAAVAPPVRGTRELPRAAPARSSVPEVEVDIDVEMPSTIYPIRRRRSAAIPASRSTEPALDRSVEATPAPTIPPSALPATVPGVPSVAQPIVPASAPRPPTAPVAVPPSLTEELQMLTAGELDVDPTEYFDRAPDLPPRRHGVVIGVAAAAVVLVAIVVIVAVAGGKSGSAASEPAPAPALARASGGQVEPATPSVAPTPSPAPPTPAHAPAPRAPIPSPSTPAPAPSSPGATPAVADPAAITTPRRSFEVTTIPAGASVTLIDGGTATVIGTTPVIASIDRSRGYDLVFALPGHQTSIFHLAAHETSPLTVDLRSVAVAPAAPTRPSTTKPRRRGR